MLGNHLSMVEWWTWNTRDKSPPVERDSGVLATTAFVKESPGAPAERGYRCTGVGSTVISSNGKMDL